MGYSGTNLSSNNRSADFNPSTLGTASLNFTQHLLQGFGIAVNSRQIHIAKNQRELSDLVFKQQVITTVSAIMTLYWDLVAFNENVRVKQQAMGASQKLYEDNKKQVQIGTLAPIEVVRAQSVVAANQQNLITAQNNLQLQQLLIKNALSRTLVDPVLAEAFLSIGSERLREIISTHAEQAQNLIDLQKSLRGR